MNLERLQKAFKEKSVVLFCGAGVSLDPPAGLPNWLQLRDMTLKAIASTSEQLNDYADLLINYEPVGQYGNRGLTPEIVVSCVSGQTEGYFTCLKCFDEGEPNANHQYLARMAKEGLLSHIITTNWDRYFEMAFEQEDVPYRVYRTHEEFADFHSTSKQASLFKLHGCISLPDTITATIEQEALGLSGEKARVLEELLRNYLFIFWGYSGWDLKIDLNYLRMETVRDTAKGFIWSLYQNENFKEKPNDHILELQKLYGKRGTITHGLLPGAFRPLVEYLEIKDHTDEERQAISERKNTLIQEALADWANSQLDSFRSWEITADLLHYTGDTDAQIACCKQMVEQATATSNQTEYAISLGHLINVCVSSGNYADALALAQRVEMHALSNEYIDVYASILLAIGTAYLQTGNPTDALRYCSEALRIAETVNLKPLAASAYEEMGLTYSNAGLDEKALEAYTKAEAITRELGQKHFLPPLLSKIGKIHSAYGRFEQSMHCFEEALEISLSFNNKPSAGYGYVNVASLLILQEAYEKARTCLTNAERFAVQSDNPALLAGVKTHWGHLYLFTDNYEKAKDCYETSIQLFRDIGSKREAATACFNLASLYKSQGLHDRFLEQAEQTSALALGGGDYVTAGMVNEKMGDYFLEERKQKEQALHYFDRCNSYFRTVHYSGPLPRILSKISECYSTKEPSLLEMLEMAVETEPCFESFLQKVSEELDFIGEFSLRSFCRQLMSVEEEEYPREAAGYDLLQIICRLSRTYREEGNYSFALCGYHGAQSIAESLHDKRIISACLNDRGIIAERMGDPITGIVLQDKALQIAHSTDDVREMAVYTYNLSVTAQKLGRPNIALSFLSDAEYHARRVLEPELLAHVLCAIGEIYKEQGDYDKACEYFEEYAQLAQSQGDYLGYETAASHLGKVHRELGNYELSAQWRVETAELLTSRGKKHEAGGYYFLAGNTLDNNTQHCDEALKLYSKALRLYLEVDDTRLAKEIQERMALCKQKLADSNAN